MSDFVTTCPVCDRACAVSVGHIRAWSSTDDLGPDDDFVVDGDQRDKEVVCSLPITCTGCDTTFWVDIAVITAVVATHPPTLPQRIPSLSEGAAVRISNKEHPLCGKVGRIIGRGHLHYRVELDTGNVWVPEHWVSTVARLFSPEPEEASHE